MLLEMVIYNWIVVFSLFQATNSVRIAETYPHLRLAHDILDVNNYDKRVRPVRNISSSTTVTMRFNLYQIVSVQERKQSVVVYMWVTQMWNDEYLGWMPSMYGDVSWTVVSYKDIWLPDTYLYNSVQMEREASEKYISVVVTSNETLEGPPIARIRLMYPALYHFTCKLDVLYFPFDRQNCTLHFGSWTTDITGINYIPEASDVMMEGFVKSEEWTVESFKITRNEKKYPCCPHAYVTLHLSLLMQRKPLYYVINFVIPTLFITIVSITGFFTPSSSNAERYEKVNLGITTLLAMSILLLMVSDQMPATAELIPLIGWFYLWIIILISTGTFLTTVTITLQGRGRRGKQVAHFWRIVFFDILAKLFFMPPPKDLVNCWKTGKCRNGKRDLDKAKEDLFAATSHSEDDRNQKTPETPTDSAKRATADPTTASTNDVNPLAAISFVDDDVFAVETAPLVKLATRRRQNFSDSVTAGDLPRLASSGGVQIPSPTSRPGDVGSLFSSFGSTRTCQSPGLFKTTKVSFDLPPTPTKQPHGGQRQMSAVAAWDSISTADDVEVDALQSPLPSTSSPVALGGEEESAICVGGLARLARARGLFRKATLHRHASRMDRERQLAAQRVAVPLEWQYVTGLLDRCLLVMFQTAALGVTAVVLVITWIYWVEAAADSIVKQAGGSKTRY